MADKTPDSYDPKASLQPTLNVAFAGIKSEFAGIFVEIGNHSFPCYPVGDEKTMIEQWQNHRPIHHYKCTGIRLWPNGVEAVDPSGPYYISLKYLNYILSKELSKLNPPT
jgi:hypothetical protein